MWSQSQCKVHLQKGTPGLGFTGKDWFENYMSKAWDQVQQAGWGPPISGDQKDKGFGLDFSCLKTYERPQALLNTLSDVQSENIIFFERSPGGKEAGSQGQTALSQERPKCNKSGVVASFLEVDWGSETGLPNPSWVIFLYNGGRALALENLGYLVLLRTL